jgi:hypothetical protein
MRCEVWGSGFTISNNRCRGLLSLCIADSAKQMLLNNHGFIPHMVDGLLLDPEHPRKDTDDAIKAAIQCDFAECLAQIAVFKPHGREALRQDSSVLRALEAVAQSGLTEGAQQHAESALLALSDTELVRTEGQKHVMLSCECGPAEH